MTPRRRRRSPEESRAELLAAAARLVGERGPDDVSLRQIAEAAGVAHGLVTHYFGTYAALVREVLTAENDRIEERVRERIRAEQGVPTAAGIMGVLFDTLADERYLRLFVWAQMHADYRGAARPELVELIDAIEAGIRAALAGRPVPSRSRIEAVALVGLSAAYGFAIGGQSWLAGMGHDPGDPAHEAEFRVQLATMLGVYMVEESGLEPAG
ncbi:TetR/AcrR family transcriptional regulator [Streptosporangium lutulentum]|uniref:AcrR family transcriptional regulator n=1 Tax=Streptosporangium lutulentum TaxID=1461250 RepID=A0ABT9Q3E5_9ACTN|nr:TetR/AcrR family transcriptional regulator [Streptosporangium lutulentum]MDP9840921.1 AcrR family transcriptional regulator [Streptosporangium lutulentum]